MKILERYDQTKQVEAVRQMMQLQRDKAKMISRMLIDGQRRNLVYVGDQS
jgi:hypothetical protein